VSRNPTIVAFVRTKVWGPCIRVDRCGGRYRPSRTTPRSPLVNFILFVINYLRNIICLPPRPSSLMAFSKTIFLRAVILYPWRQVSPLGSEECFPKVVYLLQQAARVATLRHLATDFGRSSFPQDSRLIDARSPATVHRRSFVGHCSSVIVVGHCSSAIVHRLSKRPQFNGTQRAKL